MTKFSLFLFIFTLVSLCLTLAKPLAKPAYEHKRQRPTAIGIKTGELPVKVPIFFIIKN